MKTNSRARYEGKAIRNELDKQLLYINTIVDKRQLFWSRVDWLQGLSLLRSAKSIEVNTSSQMFLANCSVESLLKHVSIR